MEIVVFTFFCSSIWARSFIIVVLYNSTSVNRHRFSKLNPFNGHVAIELLLQNKVVLFLTLSSLLFFNSLQRNQRLIVDMA